MFQVINNTDNPADPEFGYWVAYNGLLISGPYTSRDSADNAIPRLKLALDNYVEFEVKGSVTIQLPTNH